MKPKFSFFVSFMLALQWFVIGGADCENYQRRLSVALLEYLIARQHGQGIRLVYSRGP